MLIEIVDARFPALTEQARNHVEQVTQVDELKQLAKKKSLLPLMKLEFVVFYARQYPSQKMTNRSMANVCREQVCC
jgi:hypothetical protein